MDRDSMCVFALAHEKSIMKQKTFFIVPDCANSGEGVAEGFFVWGRELHCEAGWLFSWLRYKSLKSIYSQVIAIAFSSWKSFHWIPLQLKV